MGIKQLYNDNLRKLPNEYGDVCAMVLLCGLYYLLVFFSPYSIVITSLVEERAGMYASCEFVCLFCMHYFFFPFSLPLGVGG